MRPYSRKQNAKRTRRPLRTSAGSHLNAARPGTGSAVIGQRKGVDRVRLPETTSRGTVKSIRLRHAGKTLTLDVWSRRTQAGTPAEIWRRWRAGLPVEAALGGREAVARALSVVTCREARALARAKVRRSARRPARRPVRRRRNNPRTRDHA